MDKNKAVVAEFPIYKTEPGVSLSFYVDADDDLILIAEQAKEGVIEITAKQVTFIPKDEEFTGTDDFVLSFNRKGERITSNVKIKIGYSFRAKSHILSLLGDELIGSDNLAIFELVKNAYDADAENVTITFSDLNTPNQRIIVEDDGNGMTLDILKNVWLEIGTDFKRGEKRKPSKKFLRLSLGEKGVGRLAVHKLGKSMSLETQPEGSGKSYELTLNWQSLVEESDYINETSVEIKTVNKSAFRKNKGTRLTIRDLKKEVWSRGELRDLARKVNSIISPFNEIKGGFNVKIDAGEFNQWIDDVKGIEALLTDSIYYFDFKLKKGGKSRFASLFWNYKFTPPKSFDLDENSSNYPEKNDDPEELNDVFGIRTEKNDPIYKADQKHLLNEDLDGIGEITGRFYVYNLQSVVLKSFGQTQAIKSFVRENCGVKIFRDGIRVYNYGEPGDDWLGLDLARVQRLGSHFSKNVTIGSVEITQEGSFQFLKEKTNREGFDENKTYIKFKNICEQIFRLFETIAQKDRDALRDHLDKMKPVKTVGLPDTINEIMSRLEGNTVKGSIEPLLNRLHRDYNDMRDIMLNSGMTGINLGIVFHEVDREVRYINADLKKDTDVELIKQRVTNLMKLLEGFSPILRQNKNISLLASDLVEKAKNINNPRFIYHKTIFSSPLLSKENEDFTVSGPGNLLISAISNIIDNSIYWTSDKAELKPENYKPAIYIGSDCKNFNGPAIIVADNGAGFSLDPQDLVRPYRTTRPGGMGLGLYFVNLVMDMIGGKLVFPDRDDLTIPKAYNGAVLALVFPKNHQ